jgi:hypothetical protein
MSPAELIVRQAVEVSDDGAESEAFWSTLRGELRAYIDRQRRGEQRVRFASRPIPRR